MRQGGEEALAQVFEVFEVGLAYFAEEEAFESSETQAILGAKLSEELLSIQPLTAPKR